MTEWNEQLLSEGSGFVAYRLMVEGWPHQWVTDPAITHATGFFTRQVYPGLSYEGLRINERAVLREAWPEVDGITARIVASDANEDTVNGFTRDPRVVAVLTEDLDAGTSTWVTRPALAAGVYHLATEAVYADVDGVSITRAFWDTEEQEHAITEFTSSNPVPVYNWPPTMEGRRAYLYAYGPSDDPASDGQIVWRGVVVRPPRMEADGLSWTIEMGSIVTKFDQNLGASDEYEYKVRGVYHSTSCPMRIAVQFTGSEPGSMPAVLAYGFYETQDQFAAIVNGLLVTAVAGGTGSLGNLLSMYMDYTTSPGRYSFQLAFDDDTEDFFVNVYVVDMLDGCMFPGSQGDPDINGAPPRQGVMRLYAGDNTGKYWLHKSATSYYQNMTYPLPAARCMVGTPKWSEDFTVPNTANLYNPYGAGDAATWPDNRIYLEKVDGLQVDDVLLIKNGDAAPRLVRITGVNALDAYRFIVVERVGNTDPLYVTSDSSIVPIRMYGEDGHWASLIQSIVAQSPAANLGKTPWITNRDVDTSAWLGYWDAFPFDGYWRHRIYHFAKQVRVRDVFAPELMATGWMARLALDGRLDVTPMPFIAPQRTASWVLRDDEILLPAEDMVGAWPTWEAQADGLVNIVKLRLGYDAYEDDFDEAADYTVRITQSIAEHKSGNRALQEIEIRSQPVMVRTSLTGNPLPVTYNLTADVIASMVMPYLRCLSQDYAIVTVAVPFTMFPVLLGDIVEVSSQYIPDGTGARGVTGKKAICVGRSWNLDPRTDQMGLLTLWFPRDSGRVAGYAPTGRVGSRTDHGGDSWTINFTPSGSRQVAWAESTDGLITKHFAVGDAIQLVEYDTETPTIVAGVITDKPDDTHVTVQLDDTWTPGSVVWDMRFLVGMGEDLHIKATLRQAGYCWVAGDDGVYMFNFYPTDYPSAREFT